MKKYCRRFLGLILALAPLHTASAAELLYVPLVLDGVVLTYDISSLNAVGVKNSERTFISSDIIGPNGIAFDPSGNVYVSNGASNSISKFDSTGNFLSTIGSSVTLADPAGLAVDSQGNLYAANFGVSAGVSSTIAKFNPAGAFVGAVSNNVNRPFGVLVDAADNLYVGNWFTNNISKFDSSGTFQTTLGDSNNIDGPMGLAKDSGGNLFVANLNNFPIGSNVTKFDPAGLLAGYVGESANLTNPSALAIDSAATCMSPAVFPTSPGSASSIPSGPSSSRGPFPPCPTPWPSPFPNPPPPSWFFSAPAPSSPTAAAAANRADPRSWPANAARSANATFRTSAS